MVLSLKNRKKFRIMQDTKKYIQHLFTAKGIKIAAQEEKLFEAFCQEESNKEKVIQVIENQDFIIMSWTKKNRIEAIIRQNISLPNAMAGKAYTAFLEVEKWQWQDILELKVENLEGTGLSYDSKTRAITGIPIQKGDISLSIQFRLEEDGLFQEKKMMLIINPDPKSLWQNLPSNTEDPYWKPDNAVFSTTVGDKNLVAASKRGRSHANTGGFREDDFMFHHIEETGWNVIVVSDGAGSAKMSREGSRRSCELVVEYFRHDFTLSFSQELDAILANYHQTQKDETSRKNLNAFIFEHLPKAVHGTHKYLNDFAKEQDFPLKDLNATLIFAVFKKYEFGYAIMTFGVGDCPIAWLNKEQTEVKLMNRLDVGEFGGGTRFITMPEIFGAKDFYTRFGFTLVEDFSYLFLMTDGIYDPKFVVEANLEKVESWQAFLRDLQGENAENVAVDFSPENKDIAEQLSQWMDFWSTGNHDDRTLAIIF